MTKVWRKRLFATLLALVLLEATAWMSLAVLERVAGMEYRPLRFDALDPRIEAQLDRVLNDRTQYLRHDPELGWTVRAHGDDGVLYSANADGLRATREYPRRAPLDVLRIATFGDSFTHGDEVCEADTWQARLEGSLDAIEVLNFGVPAYGPGQSWLRYARSGRAFAPDIVVIGFMAENIYRAVNVFRPFYSVRYSFPLTKPRYAVRDGSLRLLPNPMPRLSDYCALREEPGPTLHRIGEHDFFFDLRYRASTADIFGLVRLVKMADYGIGRLRTPGVLTWAGEYDTGGEPFAVVTGILEGFYRQALADGALPIIVFYPQDILPARSRRAPVYRPLLQWAKAGHLRHIDLQRAFDHVDPADRPGLQIGQGGWGHYSASGHREVARHLAAYLAREGLADPESVARRLGAELAFWSARRKAARQPR